LARDLFCGSETKSVKDIDKSWWMCYLVVMVSLSIAKMNRNHWRFAALQVADVVSTLIGFSVGLSEANPAISQFFPSMGPVAGLIFGKLLTVSVILGFFVVRPSANTDKKWNFVNRLFTLIVLWNAALIGTQIVR